MLGGKEPLVKGPGGGAEPVGGGFGRFFGPHAAGKEVGGVGQGGVIVRAFIGGPGHDEDEFAARGVGGKMGQELFRLIPADFFKAFGEFPADGDLPVWEVGL